MSNTAIEQTYLDELEEKAVPGKRSVYFFHAILFSASLFIGCASFFYKVGYLGWIQLCLLLLLGYLYTVFMQSRTLINEGKSFLKNVLYLSLALFVCFCAISYFTNEIALYDALSFTCAFLLPGIVQQSWQVFVAIPSGPKRLWYYSQDIPPEPTFVYLENKPVRMRISTEDAGQSEIRSIIPASLKLGIAFYYVLKNQVKDDTDNHFFLDVNKNPYGWSFYTRKYGFRKVYLDPDETVLENRIKPNAIINAERISHMNN